MLEQSNPILDPLQHIDRTSSMNSIGSQFNLTGWVTITNPMPEFIGNYSCVFRGDLYGMMVRGFFEDDLA